MEVQVVTKLTELLTDAYQITGNMEVVGNPAVFVNDASYDTFTVRNATITPLTPGTQIGAMQMSRAYVAKSAVQVVLIDMTLEEAQLLPTRQELIAFTDTFIIRGDFISGPETKASDVFSATGPFFAALATEVVPMRPLMQEIGGQADLVYVNGSAIKTFYSPQES